MDDQRNEISNRFRSILDRREPAARNRVDRETRPPRDPSLWERTDEDRRIVWDLLTFPPEEEGRKALARLNGLSPLAINELQRFGGHELARHRMGRPVRALSASASTDELVKQGLVKEFVDHGGTAGFGLTDSGRETARLLTAAANAREPLPGYLTSLRPAE